MKANTALKGLSIVALFFAIWWSLSQINFVEKWAIKSETQELEQKLGDKLWEWSKIQYEESHDSMTLECVHEIFERLAHPQSWDSNMIQLHVVEDDLVNAFALPGGHIVLCRGLIQACERSEQLAGVMAHEIAHVRENHVMDKLISEVGLAILVGAVSGGGSSAGEILKFVLSNAYSRTVEEEADDVAVELLIEARIDPNGLVEFFYDLGKKEEGMPEVLNWVSTHPGSTDRALRLAQTISQDSIQMDTLIPWEKWRKIKNRYEQQ